MAQYSNPNQFFRDVIDNCPKAEEFLETARHELSTAAYDLIEIVGADEDTSEIESCIKDVLAEQDRTKMFTKIFEKMKRDWQSEEINHETNLEQVLNSLIEDADKQVSETNYDESENMIDYFNKLENSKKKHGGGSESAAEVGKSNEDVQVSMDTQQRKCPYTQKPIEVPVTNGECGHVYEESAVKAIIKQRRGKVKCPMPGCSVLLTSESLRKCR